METNFNYGSTVDRQRDLMHVGARSLRAIIVFNLGPMPWPDAGAMTSTNNVLSACRVSSVAATATVVGLGRDVADAVTASYA